MATISLQREFNDLQAQRVRCRRIIANAWHTVPDPYDQRRVVEAAKMVLNAGDGRYRQLTHLLKPRYPPVRLLPAPPIRRAVPSRAIATSTLMLKALDGERREITGWATRPEVDRLGDIVEPLGANFDLPMPLLHHHRSDSPVGEVITAKATKDGISIKAKLARITEPGLLRDRCDLAWAEVREGLVRGLSIGFRPKSHEPLPSGGFRFTKCDIYEVSLVSIPALASAQITVAA